MITVILVRHGKAQKGGVGVPDIERHLTEKGLLALSDAYPQTFGALVGDDSTSLEIWRSPAIRAQETAAVIEDALMEVHEGSFAASDHDCLFEQDAQVFLGELEQLIAEKSSEDAHTLICVGHVPFMEDIAHYLTGVDLPFSTGAACAVGLEDTCHPDPVTLRAPGRLLWFVQGPKVN